MCVRFNLHLTRLVYLSANNRANNHIIEKIFYDQKSFSWHFQFENIHFKLLKPNHSYQSRFGPLINCSSKYLSNFSSPTKPTWIYLFNPIWSATLFFDKKEGFFFISPKYHYPEKIDQSPNERIFHQIVFEEYISPIFNIFIAFIKIISIDLYRQA